MTADREILRARLTRLINRIRLAHPHLPEGHLTLEIIRAAEYDPELLHYFLEQIAAKDLT